jgi:hypothetical protein
VPCETESVSESAFVPAAASVIEIALLLAVEKLSKPFSFRLPVGGAIAIGGEFTPKPARLGTVGVTLGVTAGAMALVAWPLIKEGGLDCAGVPKTVADSSCRDSKASTQIACWTNPASRRCRRRLATDLVLGLRDSDSHCRKNIRARINIRVPCVCAKFGRETSKGSPRVPV